MCKNVKCVRNSKHDKLNFSIRIKRIHFPLIKRIYCGLRSQYLNKPRRHSHQKTNQNVRNRILKAFRNKTIFIRHYASCTLNLRFRHLNGNCEVNLKSKQQVLQCCYFQQHRDARCNLGERFPQGNSRRFEQSYYFKFRSTYSTMQRNCQQTRRGKTT